MLAKPKTVPTWVIRWHGAFGVTYIGRDPDVLNGKLHTGWVVHSIELAKRYKTKDAAEGAALVMASRFPEFIGTLEAREWNGKKRYP